MSVSCSNIARLHVAVGPNVPGWGSWEWVGADLVGPLSRWFETSTYRQGDAPPSNADVVLVVKHLPPQDWWNDVPKQASIVYCPVDYYGASADIDADGPILSRCARIVVHCERLRRFFTPYAPVEYMDHHVKYVGNRSQVVPADGPILWVGVRTNLPPLVNWVNRHRLPCELLILTNPGHPDQELKAGDYGFNSLNSVLIATWTPESHREAVQTARVALDIKGSDFRSRHKPPAKAIDFLASGLPLAMNADSSPVEHLAGMGFEVPVPEETDRWLSIEYANDVERFGAALREICGLERIAVRYRRLIERVAWEQQLVRGVRSPLALVS
jgi:hypothetical protein